MPFDKFVDIQTITEARRKAIQECLRTIRDEDFGLWILPGSGMGPLPEHAKRHVKEAIAISHSY
jgi:hypothetical protein